MEWSDWDERMRTNKKVARIAPENPWLIIPGNRSPLLKKI